MNFQNCSVFYLGFARERAKRRFLISNASTGNMLPANCGLSSSELQVFGSEM
jgi:hypothetical protein